MTPNQPLQETGSADALAGYNGRSAAPAAELYRQAETSSATLWMRNMSVSKTQIDRLGDRLKGDSHTENDLRLLDDYRQSFGEAYQTVIRAIRQRGESPTGRPSKSTASITEKLRRESIRLSQMQDIAGCRVVVAGVVQQEQFVASMRTVFPGASVVDRRDNPSHGYRAVHIIPEISGKPVEIQVRTELQHLWAEVSEKRGFKIEVQHSG